MKYNPVTRRQFLVGLGGALVSIPLMPSLIPEAFAAALPPKRFFGMAQCNGRHYAHWYPTDAALAGLKAPMGGPIHMREMLMRDISGQLSQVFNSSYFSGAIRDKLMMIRGLDGMWTNAGGHQIISVLGAQHKTKGATIDYILAKNPKTNPLYKDSRSYLNLGTYYGSKMSWGYNAAKNQMFEVSRERNPTNAFRSLFGTTAATHTKRGKVVDLVIENYKAVEGSAKISKNEKERLQEHMNALSELEGSLQASAAAPYGTCTTAPTMTVGGAMTGGQVDIERVNKQNMDIMIAAVKCGLANIGTMTLTRTVDTTLFDQIIINGHGIGQKNFHLHSHDTMNSDAILGITRWVADQFGYFVNALNVQEGNTSSTYLDNSFVYYGNSMGNGRLHRYTDMAVMTAGGLGGAIRTGRYIDYTNRTKAQNGDGTFDGRQYNAFLVTILQAFGLTPAEYEQPHQPGGFGTANLDKSYESWRLNRKDPLPLILA